MHACVYVFVCTYAHTCVTAWVQRTACRSLAINPLSSPSHGIWTHVIRLGSEYFHLLSHLTGPRIILDTLARKALLVDPLQGTVCHVILYKHVAGCIDQFCSIAFTVGQFSHLIRKSNSALPQCGSLQGWCGYSTERFRMSKGKHTICPSGNSLFVFSSLLSLWKVKQQWIEAVISLQPRWF